MERRRVRKKQGNTHISLAAIKQYLLYGTYPSGSTPSDKRSVRKRAESFKIEDGELYYVVRPKRIEGEPIDPNPGARRENLRKAIILPKNQLSVASLLHVQGPGGSHMGTERTLSALSSKYYWVGMANTVRKIVKNCVVCLANRPAVANISAAPAQTSVFPQVSEPDVPSVPSMPSSQDLIPEQKEVLAESQPATKAEGSPEEMQYIVTAELPEPEEVDSDLDFDPNCAVVDAVFNPRSDFDTAKKFWQKVEIQVLGPFPYKKNRTVFVVASMDSFSKWPEVKVLYKVNEKTVSQFCMELIARYGGMEQLIILENELTAEKGLDPGGICQNLQVYNVFVTKENINYVDENWNRLVSSIQRFVKLYSEAWFECLDQCLIPLRNSLTQATDFTPAFLLMGREPLFPESIIPGKHSANAEVALSQDQIEQSTDTVMSYYLQCSIPDIKRVILPAELNDSLRESVSTRTPQRKSARKVKKYHRLAGFDDGDDDTYDAGLSDHDIPGVPNGGPSTTRGSSAGSSAVTKKAAETANITKQEVMEEDADITDSQWKEEEKGDEVMEKIDMDTSYRIAMLYKSKGAYPANSETVFKRAVRKLCENFVLENGQLMYKQKGKLKKLLMTMKERVNLMRDAHIVNGEHISKAKVLEAIESANIFWKGMFMDVQGFIAACPGCKHGEPRKRRRASKKALRWFRGAEDEEDDSEEEMNRDMGKVSYEELADYLKKDITPGSLTRSEVLTFRKRAKNYKLDKGILYYCPASRQDVKPRKVLKTDKERQDALKKAHGDQHMGRSGMIDKLRKSYFWQGMTTDVEHFLASCCQPEMAVEICLDDDGERRNTVLESKIKLYQDYFAGKDIYPKQEPLDSLFPPKKGGVVTPRKDLVAAAMESAKLMAGDSTSSQEAAQPSQDADIPEPVSSNLTTTTTTTVATTVTTTPTTNTNVADGRVIIQTKPGQPDSTVPSSQSDVRNDQAMEQRGVQSAVPKIEIPESLPKATNGENEGHEEEEDEEEDMMEGMEDDDDKDEDWKPSVDEDMKARVMSVDNTVPTVAKKPSIRRRCEVCQQVIRGENNFKEHMYKHTKVKPFNCNTCNKKFTSIKGLKMHTRKHTGHRPYLCNICGRGFPRSASLRYHIRTHDKGGGLPVVCDICHRNFTTENRMQKHKRFKHPAQAPVYMCEQCGKVFTAKRSLKRHEEAHQGIRKYVCQYCKRSFFRKEYLNYHLVSHSNEDPSLASYRIKSKLKKANMAKKRDYTSSSVSIVCLDSSGVETSQNQEVYGQLVEVADPQEWPEGDRAMVYQIDDPQRTGDASTSHGEGTTVVVMEEQPDSQGNVEVRHIILPSEAHVQQHKQEQHITIHRQQPQHQREADRSQSIEVTLPTGTHTFTLPSGNKMHATESDQETVQYQVECLPGETLTEEDFNAIRMLAQASLGAHLVQQ